jgi:hypothetical protein
MDHGVFLHGKAQSKSCYLKVFEVCGLKNDCLNVDQDSPPPFVLKKKEQCFRDLSLSPLSGKSQFSLDQSIELVLIS